MATRYCFIFENFLSYFTKLLYRTWMAGAKSFASTPDDDVELIRPLRDHADVDVVLAERGEDAARRAGAEGHLPADGRDDGDVLRHVQIVRV